MTTLMCSPFRSSLVASGDPSGLPVDHAGCGTRGLSSDDGTEPGATAARLTDARDGIEDRARVGADTGFGGGERDRQRGGVRVVIVGAGGVIDDRLAATA